MDKDKIIKFKKNSTRANKTNIQSIDNKNLDVKTNKKENYITNNDINNKKGKMSKRNKKILIISSISIIALTSFSTK